MRIANRKAGDHRELQLNDLETFANLGDTPDSWRRFRLKCPDFFPKNLSEWFYECAGDWAKKFQAYPEVRQKLKPPLLFYRDRLRLVWTLNDREGVNLKLLLGFEKEKEVGNVFSGMLRYGGVFFREKGKRKVRWGTFIPGQPVNPDQQTTIGGLPPGKPIVDGTSGAITWEFGCTFQQSVYELMQQRWRAMVCPVCGKYFLADKTRQIYCSSSCFGNKKRKQALDYWRRKGSAERDKRRAKERREA